MAAARSLLAPPGKPPITRWRHQGRDPATGIDCAGVVVWVAHAVGYAPGVDFRAYERYPDGRTLRAWMERHMHRKRRGAEVAEPGDVALLRDDRLSLPLHVGMYMPGNPPRLLHSWVKARGVVETPMPPGFKAVGVYCFRGLERERWRE